MSTRQRGDSVWENVDDSSGLVTHTYRPNIDADWVPIISSLPPATVAQQTSEYAGPKTWDDVDPDEVNRDRERDASRRFGDRPPLLEMKGDDWVYLAPKAAGSDRFFLRVVYHFGITEQNYPIQCPRMTNMPCPICDYIELLKDNNMGDAADRCDGKERFIYIVLPVDNSTGAVRADSWFHISVGSILSDQLRGIVGTAAGILTPSRGRPIHIMKTGSGKKGTRWTAQPLLDPRPWPPETFALLQQGVYDVRKMTDIKEFGELKERLQEAIQAGRLPFVQKPQAMPTSPRVAAPTAPQTHGQTQPPNQPSDTSVPPVPAGWGNTTPTPTSPPAWGNAAPATTLTMSGGGYSPPVASPLTTAAPKTPDAASTLNQTLGGLPASPPTDDENMPF